MQEINLDWILTKIKNIQRFVPDDGAVGQILRRTRSGAEWSDEQGAGGSVTSVNGMQGAVVLDAADVGALPDTTPIPDSTSDLVNDSGFVNAAGAAAAAPVQSVNGQTGVVSLTIPDSTSDLDNDSGFVDDAGAAAAAPVQSVNGQTGDVIIPTSTPLDAYPVGSIYMSVNSTSPASFFGGTWEQLKDRFLLSAGDTYTAGDTGGNSSATVDTSGLSAEIIVNINGQIIQNQVTSPSWTKNQRSTTNIGRVDESTSIGSGGAKINGTATVQTMPPYLVVYMWKRTA